ADRVARTVDLIPSASYLPPDILARNSRARSPANIKCEWLSTKPGMTAERAASNLGPSTPSGTCERGPIHWTRWPAVAMSASGITPSGAGPSSVSFVTSSPMLSISTGANSIFQARIDCVPKLVHGAEEIVLAVRNDLPSADHNLGHIGRGGREDRRRAQVCL